MLAILLLAGTACETGWDVQGRVLTKAVVDKQRPLYILVGEADKTVAHPTAQDMSYRLVERASQIPEEVISFKYSRLGCHRGSVVVLAWAPVHPPIYDETRSYIEFHPEPGDYVAESQVAHPYCGWSSKPAVVTVTLSSSPGSSR